MLFGVSSSHSGQLDMSLLASSELVADQEALDKIANYYFAQELELLYRSVDERILPILVDNISDAKPDTGHMNVNDESLKSYDRDSISICVDSNK